jgi:hypothetical protein
VTLLQELAQSLAATLLQQLALELQRKLPTPAEALLRQTSASNWPMKLWIHSRKKTCSVQSAEKETWQGVVSGCQKLSAAAATEP